MQEKWALLYGILAGDGCLSRSCNKYFISIACNLKEDIIFFDDIVIPLLNDLRSKETRYKLFPKYNKIEINFSDKLFFNEIRKLGFPIGKKINQNLILPKNLENSFTYFIAGLVATDGSIWFRYKNYKKSYPIIGIKNKCKSLIYQVYNYLDLSGLNPKLREVKYKNNPKSGEYEIAIYGHKNINKFNKVVGFINPKHETKYESYLNN